MKFKMNWGWGILITIVFFMALTMVRVFIFMNQDVNLVSDNYYDKEVKYQQQIDTEKRTLSSKQEVDVKYLKGGVDISFPSSSKISGSLYFYRPSNFADDFTLPINLDNSDKQMVDVSTKEKGYWRLKINWTENNKEYYTEKVLMFE